MLIWMVLLLLPFTAAKQLTELSTSQNFLKIIYPEIDNYALNDELHFNFYVVNSSGKPLNASAGEVLCWFGYQNSSHNVLNYDIAPTRDYFLNPIVMANYTGVFSYEIHCNSTEGEYGFAVGTYYVTMQGKNFPPGDDSLSGIAPILGIFAVCFLLLYLSFNIDSSKHKFLQLIILCFVVGVSILIPKIAMDYTNNYNSTLTFFTAVTWFIRVFWVYMFFYFIYEFGKPLAQQLRIIRRK